MPEEIRRQIEANRAKRIDAFRAQLSSLLAGTETFTLEIGCGHGHFLAAYAQNFPAKLCVGIDLLTLRIARGVRKQERAGLGNLHFIKAEANEFLAAVPEGKKLAEIFFLFPDPWPKTRHYKNRLIQTAMLDRLADLSLPGATRLHFRTDHKDYFKWSLSLVGKHPAWELLPDEPWPFEQETFFSKILPDYQSLIARRR